MTALFRRVACVGLALALATAEAPAAVAAEEAASAGPLVPAPSLEERIRAAQAAFDSGSEKPFAALVAAIDADFGIDPWVVADSLVASGNPAAARAFAAAGSGPRWVGLGAYLGRAEVEKRRPTELDVHVAVASAGVRNEVARVLELTADPATPPLPYTVLALDTMRRRADALFASGRGAEAIAIAQPAAERAREIGWVAGDFEASSAAGRGAQRPFQSDVLLAAYSRAADCAMRLGNAAEEGRALNNVAAVRGMSGDYVASLEAMERAAEAYDRAPAALVSTRSRAILLMNLGEARTQIGEATGARIALDRALELLRGADGSLGAADRDAMVRGALASLCASKLLAGDVAGALLTQRELVAAARAASDADALARASAFEGKCRWEAGEWELAHQAFRTAADQFKARSDEVLRLRAVASMGDCLSALGRAKEAVELLRPTVEALVLSRDSDALPSARRELGQALVALGQIDEGARLIRQALDGALELGQREDAVRARIVLSEVLLAAGDASGALAAASAAAEDVPDLVRDTAQTDAAHTRRRWVRCYDVGLRAALALGDADAAVRFLEAGRAGALLEGLRGRAFATATVDPALARESEVRRRARVGAELALGDAVHADAGLTEIGSRRAALASAVTAERDVTARIQRESRAAARIAYPSPVDAATARADLAPNEALVIYRAWPDTAVAAVVTREETRLMRLPGADAWRAAALELALSGDKDVGSREGAAARLRDALVQPLRLAPEATRVLVSPDGPLAYVPLSLIFPDRAAAFVPSATALHELRSRPPGGGRAVLAVGDPDYAREPKLGPLPGTRLEVESIPGPKVSLLGADATPQRFAAALRAGAPWRAVHLACHGVLNDQDPWSSAVALSASKDAGGRLTSLEMVALPFRTDFVTLSACELATGRSVEAEGAVGVPQALLVAGARCVLASLWRADDDAAQLLMKTFYEEWREGESGAAEALRIAQARVRSDPRWKEPRFWAGWTLWGSPD